jgi:RHS repeat-associated protein
LKRSHVWGKTKKKLAIGLNRLVKVLDNGKSVEYNYDYRNRLVRRNDELFVHDGWQIVLTLDSKGKITDRNLWGANRDELIATNEQFMLCDHLGSVRDVVDATGKVLNHIEYNAFGKVVRQTGKSDCVFGYTGKMFDDATALQWNINRWYDANIGRWISEDPIRFIARDYNISRYVRNNCVFLHDPQGFVDASNFIVKDTQVAYCVSTFLVRKDDFGNVFWSHTYVVAPRTHGDVGWCNSASIALDRTIICKKVNGKDVYKIQFRPVAYAHAAVIPIDTISKEYWGDSMDWWMNTFSEKAMHCGFPTVDFSFYVRPYLDADIEQYQQETIVHENNHIYPFHKVRELILEKLAEIEEIEYASREDANDAVNDARTTMNNSFAAAQAYSKRMDDDWPVESSYHYPHEPYTASW